MTLRLTEYKWILKSHADCLGMFLAPAKQNGKQNNTPSPATHTDPGMCPIWSLIQGAWAILRQIPKALH